MSQTETEIEIDERREFLRGLVRFHYDLQRLRICSDNRGARKRKGGDGEPEPVAETTTALGLKHIRFFQNTGDQLAKLEGASLRAVQKECMTWPIADWLKGVRGCGPASMGVILSELDPHRAPRPSCFWKFAGLAVEGGRADRMTKGLKAPYNAWLKSKMLWLAGLFLRCGNDHYGRMYYDVKLRYESEVIPCIACAGTGTVTKTEEGEAVKKPKPCWNCEGKGEGPRGRSNAHRHQMALRYAVKQFLADLWRQWRILEGLPVVPTYAEEKLGLAHKQDRQVPA